MGQKYRKAGGPERQARLKPRFAHLYDGIMPGEWIPAWLLAEKLLTSAHQRGIPPGQRVCDEAHFDFRGGVGRPPELRALRTRVTDTGPS